MKFAYPILVLFLSVFYLSAEKKVVFIAGKKSHGYFSHEHIAGSKLLSKYLNDADVGIKSIVVTDDSYLKNPAMLDAAASIVITVMEGAGIC